MPATPPARRPTVETLCGVLLVVAFAVGLTAPLDPDLDATFGIEAYRALGGGALAAAAAVLLTVLLSTRLAAWLESAVAALVARVPRRARTPSFVALCGALFVALTDTSLSGDGMGLVHEACLGRVSPSSALPGLLQAGAVRLLPLDPRDAVRLVSCAAGLAFAALAVWSGRLCFERAADRAATTALLVTCGSVAVFFGSVEAYALPVAGTLLFLALALRRLRGSDQRPWPALALGALATAHGSALVLLPALAYVLWWAPGARRSARALLPSVVGVVAPLAVVGGVTFLLVRGGVLADDATRGLGNALGAQGQGPFLPLLPSPYDVNHRYAALGTEHLLGILNLLLLVCPVGLLLAVAGRGRGARVTFVALAAAALLALAVAWNLSYTLRRDWDLFATLGVPLALLGALRFLGGDVTPGRAARVTALGLFACVPLLLSNAGDDVQRRHYADEVIGAYRRVLESERPVPPAVQERLREGRRHWTEVSKRLDPHGVWDASSAAWEALRAGDLDTAERRAAEALAFEPDDHLALHTRAEALLLRGRDDEARALLERSLRVAREDARPRARRLLAQMDIDAGRRDAAVHQLERGLREEVAWPEEAVPMLRMLATLHREDGRIALSEALERLAERRESSGLK